MLKCADSTLYIGYTNNLEKRTKLHNAGKASKYTRSRLPVQIVYTEDHDTKSSALKREMELKQLTRQQKLSLIKNY
nr:GIY-YIG nuclease family protein [Desulfuribacillus alkaliarsenatis]